MQFILLSGSFHSNSRSLAIIEALKPFFDEHTIKVPQLNELPIYCEDIASDKPTIIGDFLSELEAAHGILFCTPEYNHSIPAVLKNAIDWASRPAFNSVLKNMPVSFITQAASPVGGARAQAHLKLILDSTLADIHICHEMMITGVDKIFDQEMKITDQNVVRRLERHVEGFIRFSEERFKRTDT